MECLADFLLDTNTLWYRGGNSRHYNVDEFWNEVVLDSNNDIFVATEVKRELEVQYYQFDAQGKSNVRQTIEEELVPSLDTLAIPHSTDAEHAVRMASSYLCSKYEIYKPQTQLQIDKGEEEKRWWNEYPGVSDARIILTTLYHESIAVTYNLKDFMLLLVMGKPLYNPVDNCYYDPIDTSILTKIHMDPIFQQYKLEIHKFINTPLQPLPAELQDEDDEV